MFDAEETMNVIRDDPKLMAALKAKVELAIESVDTARLSETILDGVIGAIEADFDDLSFSDQLLKVIQGPLAEWIRDSLRGLKRAP